MVDAAGNCKLAYFVVQECYRTIFITGLHGNTVLKTDHVMEIIANNFGGEITHTRLMVTIKDTGLRVIKEECYPISEIKGDSAVTKLSELSIANVEPGLYSIEYRLKNNRGEEISKGIEVFFIED